MFKNQLNFCVINQRQTNKIDRVNINETWAEAL